KYGKKVIRIMPNINVSYNEGAIGLFANSQVLEFEKKEITKTLSLLGMVIPCKKETDLDTLTVLAGSGPAIVAYCIDMLAKSGKSLGLTKKISDQAALQTFDGTLT